MMVYIIGTMGFFLYLLYDTNTILWRNKLLQKGFLMGSLFVFAATLTMVRESWPTRNWLYKHMGSEMFFGIVAIIGCIGLVHTLFFVIPFDETYIMESKERLAYTDRMYALCRHPGVLWYAVIYLALAGMLRTKAAMFQACFLILWNVIYIIYQDLVVFPKTFPNYGEYKKKTPFLIPNFYSMRKCIRSYLR